MAHSHPFPTSTTEEWKAQGLTNITRFLISLKLGCPPNQTSVDHEPYNDPHQKNASHPEINGSVIHKWSLRRISRISTRIILSPRSEHSFASFLSTNANEVSIPSGRTIPHALIGCTFFTDAPFCGLPEA